MPKDYDFKSRCPKQLPEKRDKIKNPDNKLINNICWTLNRLRSPHLHPALLIGAMLTYSVLLALTIPADAASSLSLIAPAEMDVSGEGSYEIIFAPDVDANGLSAHLVVPEGLSDREDARIKLGKGKSSCKPSQNGNTLQWDLSGAIKSCKSDMLS